MLSLEDPVHICLDSENYNRSEIEEEAPIFEVDESSRLAGRASRINKDSAAELPADNMGDINVDAHQDIPSIDYISCVDYQNIRSQQESSSFHDLLNFNLVAPRADDVCDFNPISSDSQQAGGAAENYFVYPQHHLTLQEELGSFSTQTHVPNCATAIGFKRLPVDSDAYYLDTSLERSKNDNLKNAYALKSPVLYCGDPHQGYDAMFQYPQKQKIPYEFALKESELASQVHTASAAQPTRKNYTYYPDAPWENFRAPYINNPAFPKDPALPDKFPVIQSHSPADPHALPYPVPNIISWLR